MNAQGARETISASMGRRSGRTPLRLPGSSLTNHIFWLTMAASLPPGGVAKCFTDEEACLRRLAEVRWPTGPVCVRCRNHRHSWIATRSLFQCSRCRHQFSVTSGTPLHRTRLPLCILFQAAESLIHYHVNVSCDHHIPAQQLADILGIEYGAARRIRGLILAERKPDAAEFLLSAVRVLTMEIPPAILGNSERHLLWLFEAHAGFPPHGS